MASAFVLKEIELNRAVLSELTKRFHGSANTPAFDVQRLRDSRYHVDAETRMDALDDDDWHELTKGRVDQALPAERFVRLYDKTRRRMYHVKEGSERPCLESEIHDNGVSARTKCSSKAGKPQTLERPDVDEVLGRLTPENGQFGPRGYQDWIAKKLQSRFTVKVDIPRYAQFCQPCHEILTRSLIVYDAALRQISTKHSAEDSYNGPCFEFFNHYRTTEALHASASAGCHLCSLLTAPDNSDLGICAEGCDASYFLEITKFGAGRFYIGSRAVGHPGKGVQCLRRDDDLTEASTLKYANTNALEIIKMAQTWLTRCLGEDEETCTVSTRFLPSRLVEITTRDESLVSARVVLKEELSEVVPYLTLSHCWGKIKIVTLEKSTYEDYRTQLPLSRLSKTFREALQVTAWLGYQYIWIDSLCILQDSSSDWEHEAAMMGAVYRHSTCTIAATGAEDGNGGLFFQRSALAFLNCPLFGGHGGNVYACNDRKWPTPLSSRAWVVQERYLSPRLLSFGSDKISWSCRRTEACEGSPAHEVKSSGGAFPTLLDQLADKTSTSVAWEKIVGLYTSCKLTHWKDKWPAFQGLASEVAEARHWRIVHGLRSHLPGTGELLWCNKEPELGTVDVGEPSWSWLNVKGQAVLRNLERDDGPHVDMALRDWGRETKDAAIRIEACMATFTPRPPEHNVIGLACTLTLSEPQAQSHHALGQRPLHGYWSPDSIPICNSNKWALQMLRKRNKSGMYWFEGLVVAAVDARPGRWRRLGTYTTYDTGGNDPDCPFLWGEEKTTVYLI